ncbi:MAG: pyridoxamine 5'-phosphate oxidase [Candidatus Omnitrophica bacterium]|nr:pyridoxamine 5'-phosphate oxidase [Candidatus Omnitrophota bacterium]
MIDPLYRFLRDMKRAGRAGVTLPNAMALATATKRGAPSVRTMLLKSVQNGNFIFYTNLVSRKVGELKSAKRASMCFWWPPLKEQVRIEGTISPVSTREADEYFASRPRGSQIAAWASQQSRVLSSRAVLFRNVSHLEKKFKGRAVPRPPFWSGFKLKASKIEFWFDEPSRLHRRYLYVLRARRWRVRQLYP